MTTRSCSARLVQCFVLALLGMLLDVTAAQAKKADSDKSRDDVGGEHEKPSRELPAAALFGRVSPSIVVVEVVLERSIPKPRQTDEQAEAHCKAGDIAACIAEGKALEKTNRVGALALYLKGCSQSDGEDPSKRALAADACSAAARLVDVMGDKAHGERLRKQAAESRAQK